MAVIKTATSPRFLDRIEAVLGATRVTLDDCGAPAVLPRGGGLPDARSPVGCACEEGVCLACYAGDGAPAALGDPVGRAAVTGFKVALRAYTDRAARRADATIQPRWPGEGGAAMAPLALAEGPVRLAALFEARVVGERAVVSELDGEVALGPPRRATVPVVVRAGAYAVEHLVPRQRTLRVATGDVVRACDALTDGAPHPRDVLRVLGEQVLACWMIGEALAIFRAVDVALPERYVALLLRRMLARVTVTAPNDARFAAGERVERAAFERENARLEAQEQQPARAELLLEGLSELVVA